MISAILLITISIFLPPIPVAILAGCGPDLLINILLCILAVFPGHIHAFYIMYVYYKRQEDAEHGVLDERRAPLVFSDRVNRGGVRERRLRERGIGGYGAAPPPQDGYGTMGAGVPPPPQQGYHAQQGGFAPPPPPGYGEHSK